MSKVLHVQWVADRLHVSADERINGARRWVSRETLRQMLGELPDDALIATVGMDDELILYPLVDATDDEAPERIPTLAFAPADAVDLLMLLRRRRPGATVRHATHAPAQHPCDQTNGHAERHAGVAEPGTDFIEPAVLPALGFDLGASVDYFARLAEFILRCIAGGQFYPDVQQAASGDWHALWRPLVGSARDVAKLSNYADAMPERCFNATRSEDEAQPSHIVELFLLRTLNSLIRRDVAIDPFFQHIGDKASQPFATPEVHWLAALLAEDNRIGGPQEEMKLLAQRVSAWSARLDETRSSSSWRLCLTLHEPDPEADDGWPLTFGLQNADDPSESIDAAALFTDNGAGLLGRNVSARRARLMTELSRAREFCPPLERLGDGPAPVRLELTTVEAHLFIRQWAPLLMVNEFRVFLPPWVTEVESSLGLLLHVRPHGEVGDPMIQTQTGALDRPTGGSGFDIGSGRMGLQSLMDFDWQIAVGDLRLSIDEFKALAADAQPFVKYAGRWLRLDVDAARETLDFLDRQSHGRMTLSDALRASFGTLHTGKGLPVLGVQGTGWVGRFLEQTDALRLDEFPQPESFRGTLRPYQLRGLQWLNFLDQLGIGGCLADDMGLGKTVMLIALLLREREQWATMPDADSSPDDSQKSQDAANLMTATGQRHNFRPTLLFAPTSVVGNWMREAERFGPSLRVLVHHGSERLSGEAFAARAMEHDLVITSYALAHRDVQSLASVQWHRITLDEAQKIKNPAAAATTAIRSLQAERHIALTGTPIENHLSELWSIMDMLNPGLLGTAGEFREHFAIPVEKQGDQQRVAQLRNLIRPFVLRRTKTDPQVAGDLPQKLEMKVFCNLTPEQAALYEQLTAEMLGRIDSAEGIRRRGLILAALTRLKQVCDHPALLAMAQDPEAAPPELDQLMGRSGKVERLVDMLEEVIEAGDSALIFTQYRRMGHLLERILAARLGVSLQFLHGGTPSRTRDQMIERFQQPGSEIRIFLLSLRAGGLGLNLTAANHVFHFDRWWNPAVEAQATDRAYRIGQTRKVQVHKFICAGTMEERIDRLLTDKIALADRIVSSGDEWLTNLSTEELRDYLSLSRDAVGEYES